MLKLLVLADDFTGALDTGVKFADVGIHTQVVAAREFDFNTIDPEVTVLVIDLQTRHQLPDVAYDIVYQISEQAVNIGVRHILKKTDSALRGNIGSELTALYDASKQPVLPFIPALPAISRTTVNGIHLIEGVPVNESVFGRDPFSPVYHASVVDIIKEQSTVATYAIPKGAPVDLSDRGILVLDSETNADLLETAKSLHKQDALSVMAGCSGIGAVLPEVLGLTGGQVREFRQLDRFVVVCGSVNPITTAQVLYAEAQGFEHIELTLEEKMKETFWETDAGKQRVKEIVDILNRNPRAMISSFDRDHPDATLEYGKQQGISANQVGDCIAASIGRLLKEIIETGFVATFLVTGGDTLLGFMNQIQHHELDIITEIAPGSVLSQLTYNDINLQLISKSGGFGTEDVLIEIAEKLNAKKG